MHRNRCECHGSSAVTIMNECLVSLYVWHAKEPLPPNAHGWNFIYSRTINVKFLSKPLHIKIENTKRISLKIFSVDENLTFDRFLKHVFFQNLMIENKIEYSVWRDNQLKTTYTLQNTKNEKKSKTHCTYLREYMSMYG